MVHYDFNLGSPAANIAPERTGGQYATRHAGQIGPSIRTEARQPKARLNWFDYAGSAPAHTPTRPPNEHILWEAGWGAGRRGFAQRAAPNNEVVTASSNRNATPGIHSDSAL